MVRCIVLQDYSYLEGTISEAEIKKQQVLRAGLLPVRIPLFRTRYSVRCHPAVLSVQSHKENGVIIPTGFQVDYNAQLHNDYTCPEYAAYGLVTIDHASGNHWVKLILAGSVRLKRATYSITTMGMGRFCFVLALWADAFHRRFPDASGRLAVSEAEKARITRRHRRLQGTNRDGTRDRPSEPWVSKLEELTERTRRLIPGCGFSATTTMLAATEESQCP